MKQILLLISICMFTLSSALSAKEFHFAYIRIDPTMEKSKLMEQVKIWKDSRLSSDLVLFYSNSTNNPKMTMDAKNWSEQELFGLISTHMSSVAITVIDEFDALSVLLEKYLKLEIIEDDFGFRRVVSAFDFDAISFYFFVGSDFLGNDYQNLLLAKLLLANSLDNFSVNVCYYPCGANYNDETIKFKTEYGLNEKIKPYIYKENKEP